MQLPNYVIARLIARVSSVAPGFRSRFQTAVIRAAYSTISVLLKVDDLPFLNYGYVPLDGSHMGGLKLNPEDERDRFSIQLYYRVAGGRDLRGKDVLEIGCGRGGGSSFIARYLHPASLTGVDLSDRAVRYCRRRHRVDGLKFLRGDAEHLPLPSHSFDAVVNVESSHCYPSFERFLDEVVRVLRPGGLFLFADLRPREEIARLREQLSKRFTVVEEEIITPNVVRALELDSDRRRLLIEKRAPRFLHRALETFASVNGTPTFSAFASGGLQYVRFVLQ
ncbi:MAG: class I SAM-dependent methyltransferase [Acidobacteriia bacterium]|nr:class I SAM-dependent methyltransferase [Terriglobia bacterium]MBV9742169.1 class I SAM-dependent methyltransferase [Terriglobia bacterium]